MPDGPASSEAVKLDARTAIARRLIEGKRLFADDTTEQQAERIREGQVHRCEYGSCFFLAALTRAVWEASDFGVGKGTQATFSNRVMCKSSSTRSCVTFGLIRPRSPLSRFTSP